MTKEEAIMLLGPRPAEAGSARQQWYYYLGKLVNPKKYLARLQRKNHARSLATALKRARKEARRVKRTT